MRIKAVIRAGGGHIAFGWTFVLPYDYSATSTAQIAWRYCRRCHGLFYDGLAWKGWCAAGGDHVPEGYNYALTHDVDEKVIPINQTTTQKEWRYCRQCRCLFYNGFAQKGRRSVGGIHAAQGWNFILPHDLLPSMDFDCSPIVMHGTPVRGNSHLTLRQDR